MIYTFMGCWAKALCLSLSFSVPGFGPKYISIIITSVKSRRPVLQKKKNPEWKGSFCTTDLIGIKLLMRDT